jgi:hypothetical protein
VISAAVLCTIVIKITENKGSISFLIKILAGIFLSTSVLTPMLHISFAPITEYINEIQTEASFVTDAGVQDTSEKKEIFIKNQLEAYIVDKAKDMNLSIEAQIELNEDMIPVKVLLQGNASPYYRMKMESYITDTLGIQKEDQVWM